jgi:hypothetical protein
MDVYQYKEILRRFAQVQKIHKISIGAVAILVMTMAFALTAYQSGFEHGISDGKMAGVNWYILQPGKDFAFHTWEFVQGYVNGFW